jgi:hypothetical protein
MITPDSGRESESSTPTPSGSEEVELLVFSDDWGRHPSSCQHLVSRLLARYPVYWCNTIGTRRPRLDLYTLRRGAQKLLRWGSRGGARSVDGRFAGPAPRLIEPVMWPSFRSRAGRAFNRSQLDRAVRALPTSGRRRIGLTTLPVVADLVGVAPVDRWVYYCVDDLASWPGLDRPSLERMERELVVKVDGIIAASEELAARIAALGREAPLLTHGVDLAHWVVARDGASRLVEGLERPLVVFWGVVDRRLDMSWIEALTQRLDAGTVLLVGPSNQPEPRLGRLPRVELRGAVDYDELPGIAAAASVLIMPYLDSPATRAMQPLKLKEYLATRRPVVARELPALEAWRDACDVASSADEFARRVLDRVATGAPERQLRARRRLEGESWERKADAFERLLLGAPVDAGWRAATGPVARSPE